MKVKTSPKILRTIDDLVETKLVSAKEKTLADVIAKFAVAITPSVLTNMNLFDKQDPIAKQYVPSIEELNINDNEIDDPIGDKTYSPVKGIIHRYPDRALFTLLHTCPVYCRFCFRREMVGQKNDSGALTGAELDAACDYIKNHSEIWEVILSGGDPLMLSDRRIADVIDRLCTIDHVKIIRIHSRVPVVDPARITDELVSILKCSKPVYVFLHANHAREFTPDARAACARLIDAGIPMLSQSVLLKGINDTETDLEQLMRTFVQNRITPHYLHHLDLAKGTSHFRVPLDRGRELLRSLRGRVSGLCQPTYVLDIPGGFGKIPVGHNYVTQNDDGWLIEDIHGTIHHYNEIK
jgi:lysine 2,3-aminomutase